MAYGLILAAGKGTRMNSPLPKPLHLLHGKPLLAWVIDNMRPVCTDLSIVVNSQAEALRKVIGNSATYIEQAEQLGTGHAVFSARDYLQNIRESTLLVLAADHPLIRTTTMRAILMAHQDRSATITLTTAIVPDFNNEFSGFYNYGRIIRNGNTIVKVVEYKECTAAQKEIREVNISCIAFDLPWLLQNIGRLQKHPTNEYYLMDMVSMALDEHKRVESYQVFDAREGFGINTPEELQLAHLFTENVPPDKLGAP